MVKNREIRLRRGYARIAATVVLSTAVMIGAGHAQCGGFINAEDIAVTQCRGIVSLEAAANAAVAELLKARDAGEIKTGADQARIFSKYLRLVEYDENNLPENPVDRAALGELYFRLFEPVEADKLFSGLMNRPDLIGRLAWQRMMQMRRAAFDRPDEVRAMLVEYRKKYPYTEEDVDDYLQQVVAFAQADFEAGAADKAMDLLMEETASAPADAPYRIFAAYENLSAQIAESGREDEYKSLLASKLEALETLEKDWAGSEVSADKELRTRASAPEWFWLYQRVARDETIRAARRRQLEELILDLKGYLSE